MSAEPASVESTQVDFGDLLTPYQLRNLTLKNRFVMAPMTRSASPNGVPTQEVADYYARRAPHLGLLISEGTYIDHPSAGSSADVPHLYGEEALAGWKRVIDTVHQAGGLMFPQLWHLGARKRPNTPPYPDAPVISPSGIGIDGSIVGEPMTLKDIDDVIDAFHRAGRAAVEVGADGVEIHGAHGYLPDQFIWGPTNRRTDGYSFEHRTRFASEVIAAVREGVGDLPISFRYSQWKADQYDARIAETPQELEAILTPLADAGVDAFHVSTRRFWLPAFEGSPLTLHGWTKKITGKAVIAVGSLGIDTQFGENPTGERSVASITPAAQLLAAGEFDLLATGRTILADPEWTVKAHEGRTSEITPFTNERRNVLW